MRKVGLIDVAGRDIVLTTADTIYVGRPSLIRCEREAAQRIGVRFGKGRAGQPSFQCGQPIAPLSEQFLARLTQKALQRWAEDEEQAILFMVERSDKIEECKLKIGGRKVVKRDRRQPLELADEIVTEIADRPTKKRRDTTGPSDV